MPMTFDPKAPPALLELDRFVAKILIRPLRKTGPLGLPVYPQTIVRAIEERISRGLQLSAAQRLGLYNQQFWFRMFAALQQDYPTLHRLFGPSGFNRLIAEPFIRAHFPNFWQLAFVGFELPRWVKKAYADEDKPLVYQTALIDQIHNRLLYATPHPSLQPSDLPSLASSPLFLQPTIAPLDLPGDFAAFRASLLKQEPVYWEEHDFPQIDWTPRSYVFFLSGGEVIHEEISPEESKLLQAFQKGSTLDQALLGIPGESITDWFKKWAQRGWLHKGGRS